jgi:hypothetical protein
LRCKEQLCISFGNLVELEEIDDDLDLELDEDGEDILNEPAEDIEDSGQRRTDEAKDSGQQLADEAENVSQEGKNVVLDNGRDKAKDEVDEFDDDLVDR